MDLIGTYDKLFCRTNYKIINNKLDNCDIFFINLEKLKKIC
jgi:hypothetical protein